MSSEVKNAKVKVVLSAKLKYDFDTVNGGPGGDEDRRSDGEANHADGIAYNSVTISIYSTALRTLFHTSLELTMTKLPQARVGKVYRLTWFSTDEMRHKNYNIRSVQFLSLNFIINYIKI